MSEISCKVFTPEAGVGIIDSCWIHPSWMNAVAQLYNIEPKLLVCYKNTNLVAILPYYEKRKLGRVMAYNPVLVYYSPVLYNLPDKKNANHNLLTQYEILLSMGQYLTAKYKPVNLNLAPAVYDIRALKEAGMSIQPAYTFIQDLHAPIDFFKTEKGTLRKAQNDSYQFEQKFTPERLLELVYAMFSRKQHPFDVPRSGHLKLLNTLHEANLVEQYNICKEGEIVSSMLIIPTRDETAYAWQFATAEADMKNGAALLMFWEVFQTLGKRFRYLDLCGANSSGPSRIKAALGAELKLFFQIRK